MTQFEVLILVSALKIVLFGILSWPWEGENQDYVLESLKSEV